MGQAHVSKHSRFQPHCQTPRERDSDSRTGRVHCHVVVFSENAIYNPLAHMSLQGVCQAW
jgi:hypothetical protein